jgi:ABC-type glycerol-3-phosphate transport system substrate-binding protein
MRKLMALLLCALMILAGPSAMAQDYSGVTLYVVDINPDSQLYDDMIDAFIADHPGIKVETTHAVNDALILMSSLIAAGNTPNIFVSTPEYINTYEEYLYDWQNDADVLGQFKGGYIDSIAKEDGAVYGLPNGCINVGLVYDKDILAQAGYDEVPLTMDAFTAMCADIYEKTGAAPFACAGHESFMLAHMLDAYIVTQELPGNVLGGKFDAGELKVSDASGNFSSFWRMMDIAKTYTDGETLMEYDWEYACNLLANGKVAMITYGDWSHAAIAAYNDQINLGFSSYPVSENADDAITPTSVNQVALLFEQVDNFEVAKELAVFLTASYESAQYIIGGYGSVSCNKASDDVDAELFNSLLLQSQALASTGRCVDRMQNYYPTASGADFMADAGEAIQAYLIGLLTQEEATAAIDAAWPITK